MNYSKVYFFINQRTPKSAESHDCTKKDMNNKKTHFFQAQIQNVMMNPRRKMGGQSEMGDGCVLISFLDIYPRFTGALFRSIEFR